MSRPLSLAHVASAVTFTALPPSRAEVVLIGRSNVGKSSLLNAIAGRQLARVSHTPGRTHVLDFFQVAGSEAAVVDCPGYGYAKVSRKLRLAWLPMVADYLLGREQLTMVMLLVDGEIGPTDSDLDMLQWLREKALPHTIVATKYDKVKPSRRDARRKEFSAKCRAEAENIVWVSVPEDEGLSQLRDLVRLWLA